MLKLSSSSKETSQFTSFFFRWLGEICVLWCYYFWYGVWDLLNLGTGLFQDCSKTSNIRAHKTYQVTHLKWNAVPLSMNQAEALRRQLHIEHYLLWWEIYDKCQKMWAWGLILVSWKYVWSWNRNLLLLSTHVSDGSFGWPEKKFLHNHLTHWCIKAYQLCNIYMQASHHCLYMTKTWAKTDRNN